MTRIGYQLVAIVLLLNAAPLHSQVDSRLVAAVRQAQEGRGDSARASVARLLEATPVTDTLYPQILYASALIAPTAQEMQRNLQRITVEHALSPWADDALLKLAQLEYASGNLPGTVRSLERLRADYPGSTALGVAAFWAARTYFDMQNEKSACEWVGAGLAATSSAEIEARNQLDAFVRRCPAARAAQTDPAAAAVAAARSSDTTSFNPVLSARVVPAAAAPAPAPPAGPVFRVQVVAAASQSIADGAARRLEALGVESRIVPEGGFFKVRAGSYTTRADAVTAARRLATDFPGAFPVSEP